MKKLTCIALGLAFALQVQAQKYNTAAGIRLEKNYGISIQQKVYNNIYLEGIARYNFKDKASFTMIGKQYKRIVFQNLNYYYGGGLKTGWIKDNIDPETGQPSGDGNQIPFGVAGVAGVEVTLNRINIGFDWQPNINVTGADNVFDSSMALSVRYVIFESKKQGIFQRNKKSKKNKKKGKNNGPAPILGKKRNS